MRVTALAGGVGAARFLRGLVSVLDTEGDAGQSGQSGQSGRSGQSGHELTVVGNTGDDITLFGLRVCPDLDTVMYTLGGGIDDERGWGRGAETWRVQEELVAYGAQPQWFGLGDRDMATHILRTQMLESGYRLGEVTEALCRRWGFPQLREQVRVRLLPMSDERVETHVVLEGPDGTSQAVHFQEWWVRLAAQPPAQRIVAVGAGEATPGPGVLEAIRTADVVVLPPSNPVVSIGTILAVPGVREALRTTTAPVVGVSPIIGGAPVRGMADACLRAIGVATTAAAVGALYADFLDGWLVDPRDGDAAVDGVTVRACPLLMRDLPATAAIAAAALELAAAAHQPAP